MKHDEQKRLLDVDPGAAAGLVDDLGSKAAIEHARNVAARASDGQDVLRRLSHAHQVVRGPARARKVEVRELGDGVPRALVDRARDLSPLDVRDADVHVGGRDGRGQRLVAVPDEQDDVGFELPDPVGQLPALLYPGFQLAVRPAEKDHIAFTAERSRRRPLFFLPHGHQPGSVLAGIP